ncbi:MAG: carbon starvation CstA family protein [bacterium]
MLKKLVWLIISIIAAFSIAVILQAVHSGEKINALWLVVATACIYSITYRFYASFIAAKVLTLSDSNITPANNLKDGIDYEPTNKWVLFGHHFAAIAGGGPLIGPMLAAQFGYLPGFLWILIGASLCGSVHDMVILAASVRKDGKSLAQIAKEEIGLVGGVASSLAIIFIIIIALAGLAFAVVNALVKNAWGTYTIAMTIPIALMMGFYLQKLRPGKVVEMSIIGVILLFLAVITGHYIPNSPVAHIFTLSKTTLTTIIVIYGFFASVLPVWMLLCPRDYLSTYMKIGTMILLTLSVLFIAPSIQMPAITAFVNGGGPIIPGKIFPFMFITIACGAISGFHSLIASGTTPKMIISEKDITSIGFGAMLVEGMISMMALIAATILIPGDYFAINTHLSATQLASMGFPVSKVYELSKIVGVDVVGRPGGAVSLAVGMASILSNLPGLKALMPYWYNFALMFEALFILTTVDAGTRVARFLLQDISGYIYKPFSRQNWLPGILISSLAVVLAWGYLVYTGNISSIWPMFGVSNQLLAAIALGIGTIIIVKLNKKQYAWITALPMTFMFITTFTAAYQLVFVFLAKASKALTVSESLNFKIDAVLVVFLAVLAFISLIEIIRNLFKLIKFPITMEEPELLEENI